MTQAQRKSDAAAINAGAALLSARQALTQDFTLAARLEATAIILAKAGTALAANNGGGKKILSAIRSIEDLAGISGLASEIWLALRATGAPAAAQIGVTATLLENPVLATLMDASGLIPTTDTNDQVRAVLSDTADHGFTKMVVDARIVTFQDATIVVSTATGVEFVLDVKDAEAALSTLDIKNARAVLARQRTVVPLSYARNTAAQPQSFSQAVFAPYNVKRITIPGARKHVTDLVESAALASVNLPVPSYQPFLHTSVVSQGILSDVQLEAVIYAGEAHTKFLVSHPDDSTKTAPRQGILIGHGTGVGKSRIACGIIADNWAQGRRRHIWLTESARLIDDLRSEWMTLGGRAEDIIDIREMSNKNGIPQMNGILFATYASLRLETEAGSRMAHMAEWFGAGEDGVIIFDEAQNLRNAKAEETEKVSRQGLAAIALQDRLPNARVVYASATSASDIVSMGFATRLGIWGKGTAFPSAMSFFQQMQEGGTNALEMVARDLKAMGIYLAANLSFEGVVYERLERRLTDAERQTQDELARIWIDINADLQRAKVLTGASKISKKVRGNFHKVGHVQFGMARARFFQSLLTSLNTPHAIEALRDDLARGHAGIVQLTNTFEANAEKAIAAAEEAGIDINQVEASPREIILSYLRDFFPVQVVSQTVVKGVKTAGPLRDQNGDPVIEPRAAALRDALIARVQALDIPEGPIEQIIRAFGAENIAEVTGRSRRLVRHQNGSQVLEDRSPEDVKKDVEAFMNDTKRILIFSQAGATGATYSAQRTCANQRLRRHYVLQAGWRSDLALQGMGRSHRSNQAQPPEYVLLSTDLWANQRMTSAVAKGMRDLGALTRGLRQAASQEFFTQDENLEDEYAAAAWDAFVANLYSGLYNGLSVAEFEAQACINLRNGKGQLLRPLPPLRRFLNAMSAMTCDNQTLFGQHFRTELENIKVAAIEDGSFDRGIETITPQSLIKLEDTVIYQDPRTGGETRLLKMLRIDELELIPYAEARSRGIRQGNMRIAKSVLTGRISILCFPMKAAHQIPSMDDLIEVYTPTGKRIRTRDEIVQERWTPVDVTLAESIWNAEMQERGTDEEQEFYVISGAMLPIWDKLPRDRVTVFRMETDEGEQIIGRLVSETFVDKLLQRVDALASGGLSLDQVTTAILNKGVVTLVNGWTLQGRINSLTGTASAHLVMPAEDSAAHIDLVNAAKLTEIYGAIPDMAYLQLPRDEDEMRKSLGLILKTAPAATAASL